MADELDAIVKVITALIHGGRVKVAVYFILALLFLLIGSVCFQFAPALGDPQLLEILGIVGVIAALVCGALAVTAEARTKE